jgi:hypothetical protein
VLDLHKYKAAEENKAKDNGLQIKQGSSFIVFKRRDLNSQQEYNFTAKKKKKKKKKTEQIET